MDVLQALIAEADSSILHLSSSVHTVYTWNPCSNPISRCFCNIANIPMDRCQSVWKVMKIEHGSLDLRLESTRRRKERKKNKRKNKRAMPHRPVHRFDAGSPHVSLVVVVVVFFRAICKIPAAQYANGAEGVYSYIHTYIQSGFSKLSEPAPSVIRAVSDYSAHGGIVASVFYRSIDLSIYLSVCLSVCLYARFKGRVMRAYGSYC